MNDAPAKITPNPELERAALACVMQGFPREELALVEADFQDPRHRAIWRAMATTENPDLLGLHAALAARQGLEAVGGAAYLASLTDLLSEAGAAPRYARSIRELRLRFDMAKACRQLAAAAETPSEAKGEDLLAQMAYAHETLERLLSTGEADELSGLEAVANAYESTTGVRQIGQLLGVSTGFRGVDDVLQGLERGRLIVIAGRPGMGKSAFADDVALYLGTQKEVPVGIYTLEMSKQERHARMLAKLCSIDHARIRAGRISDRERPKIAVANNMLRSSPLRMNDRPGKTFPKIAAEVRRQQRHRPLGLLVIDYLGRMRLESQRGENRNQELGDVARGLKDLAMDLQIPILALHQLNREPEKRSGGRPQLSDLRDSGELEQEADVVAFIYREEVYSPKPDNHGKAELIIAKHRGGPTASVELHWTPEFVRFDNP